MSAKRKFSIYLSISFSINLLLIFIYLYIFTFYSTLLSIASPQPIPSSSKKAADSTCAVFPTNVHTISDDLPQDTDSPLTEKDTAFYMSTTRQSRNGCPTDLCQLAWDCGDWCEHYFMQCEDCRHVWDGQSQCDHMH